MLDTAQTVAKHVASRAGFEKPRVAVVLGSGLGEIADSVKLPLVIPYANLPGFPVSGVSGHAGRMVLGRLGGLPVVVMQGRVHLYEGMRHDDIKTFVRTLKRLGCETIFVTNAAGSLRRDMAPGSLMMVNDHINLIPGNPLIGPNDDAYGDRFPTLENAYDPDLRDRLTRAAERLDIKLRDGVKFHDGTPFNAEAVKFTFDRVLDPAKPARGLSMAGPISGVKVVDALTVDI